ncbi:9982_t:CDS:10 [Scutellospora calospora]|uniref:9982_t:CDS:1 n=1 Tax=Scutellospora calospora TaxID=85575 RepID=A0ACA9KQ69_9GLOM|nr:9982_t:CDS:10 [Scutellospora calospora]
MSKPTKLCTISDYESFIDKFDTFLIDCDGVLWKGDYVIPGKKILFVTNNSAKSRADYFKKFKNLNIEANEDEIFSSSYASAYYLKNILKFPKDKKIYVIGESGIADELALEGIRYCGLNDNIVQDQPFTLEDITPDPEVGAVLCGIDRYINYRKLAKALYYLNTNPGCIFLLTNNDSTFPFHDHVAPGAGAIAAPLITSLNRDPDCIVGKPNKPMMDCIIQKFHLNIERTCMIGDRLETDIKFGINGGITTLLVLTGISSEKDFLGKDVPFPITPDYYMSSLEIPRDMIVVLVVPIKNRTTLFDLNMFIPLLFKYDNDESLKRLKKSTTNYVFAVAINDEISQSFEHGWKICVFSSYQPPGQDVAYEISHPTYRYNNLKGEFVFTKFPTDYKPIIYLPVEIWLNFDMFCVSSFSIEIHDLSKNGNISHYIDQYWSISVEFVEFLENDFQFKILDWKVKDEKVFKALTTYLNVCLS